MSSRGAEPIRVLVVDDHFAFRLGLRTLIDVTPNVEVVGEAASGTEAVEAAAELQPDVVIMDLQMPELNGIEATRRIVQTSPHIGVLVLTMSEKPETLFAAMRAGACGYLLKESGGATIVRAVEAVADGEAIFGPAVAQQVMTYFSGERSPAVPEPFPHLTAREREVLEMIAQGQNNASIASRLYVSQKTVRNHVSNIFTKLEFADRAQAIVRAREAGLGNPSHRS